VHIRQLNVQYQPGQDRILTRINTSAGQEFRLWLTRRLCLGWLPALRKVNAAAVQRSLSQEESGMAASDPQVREMLGEFQRQRQLDAADFNTPFVEAAPGLPVEELLVSELSMTPQPDGPTQLKFAAPLPGSTQKRELQAQMDGRMLAGFLHLLENAFQAAQWGEASDTQSLPAATAAERPTYLN
jgi:hypothetical protein